MLLSSVDGSYAGTPLSAIDADAAGLEQREVGVIAGEQEHPVGRQGFTSSTASAGLKPCPTCSTITASGVISTTRVSKRAGMDPSAMRLSMSGFTQYLIEAPEGRPPMDQRHVRAGPKQLQRGFCRRVLAADDHHALPIARVRVAVVVRDVGQILAGHTQPVRVVVVSDGKHDGAGAVGSRPRPGRAGHGQHPGRLVAIETGYPTPEFDAEVELLGDAPVVSQRLDSSRLLIGRHQRHAADLEQLRRREKRHVHGELINRVHQHALFEHRVVQPRLPRSNCRRQPRRAGADDDDVAHGHWVIIPVPKCRGAECVGAVPGAVCLVRCATSLVPGATPGAACRVHGPGAAWCIELAWFVRRLSVTDPATSGGGLLSWSCARSVRGAPSPGPRT